MPPKARVNGRAGTTAAAPLGSAPRIERESTYDVPTDIAAPIFCCLDAMSVHAIDVNGASYSCRAARTSVRTYWYLKTDDDSGITDRLVFKFSRRRAKLRAALSSKVWSTIEARHEKYHFGETRYRHVSDIVALLRARPVVESALVKVQRRYEFASDVDGGFAVSFDAMAPVWLGQRPGAATPFVHLEIESVGDHDPFAFTKAVLRSSTELRGLQKTVASKKELAAAVFSKSVRVCPASDLELRELVAQVSGDATKRLHAIVPRLFAEVASS